MGVVIDSKSFTSEDGTEYTVEYNNGNSWHIHIDGIRVQFSEEEFEVFSQHVIDAKESLEEKKDI